MTVDQLRREGWMRAVTVDQALSLFRTVVSIVLSFVPHEMLAAELDAAARAKIDAEVDALEREKLGQVRNPGGKP